MRWSPLLVLTACSFFEPEVGDVAPPIDAGPPISFAADIRPLMDRGNITDPTGRGCKPCHYSTEKVHPGLDESGLDLSTLGALRRGGNDTQRNIIVPYDPDGSALVQKLYGTFGIGQRMPRDGPPYWTDEEIELVETWIAQGAKGDDSE